ncbi:phage tail tape measure protein [Frigidibacter oleivorans]|uniref:phage tail tape measure protein n=1 Tax=Frigidibacter oleivorans TaxID=2487129 RepID=UPI000F8D15D7|nr:phage tail tape measure protein [Frigidibacter oleivorans]
MTSEEFDDLDRALDGAGTMVAAFAAELARMQDSLLLTSREVSLLSSGIGRGLRSAFDGLVFDGIKLSDALETVARSMADAVYAIAMKPVTQAAGTALAEGVNALTGGLFAFADGAGFTQGRVMPFAEGGIVARPTYFPMRGGTGLMGEAGPEAILPLSRGADGRLGVASPGGGGRAVNVTMQVTTPDVAGFRRSQGQIAAQLARAMARGERLR